MVKEEFQIISHLRNNARTSLLDVSKQLGIPSSTVHQKVKYFEFGIIKKHTTLVNFTQLGFMTHCFMVIGIKKEYREALAKYLLQDKNTNSVFRIDSQQDFLVECVFRNVGEQKDFTNVLHQNFGANIQAITVLDSLKQEDFLTDLSKFPKHEFG